RWSHLIVILLRCDSHDLKSVKHTDWAAFLRNVRMVRPFGTIGDNGGSTPQIQHLVSIHVDVSTKSQIPILVADESRVKLQIESFVFYFTVGQIGKNSGCSRYRGNGLIKQEVGRLTQIEIRHQRQSPVPHGQIQTRIILRGDLPAQSGILKI